jgi:DNA-binding NarL/FixJ family response regulator
MEPELRRATPATCDRTATRVLVVDDHDGFRAGLAALLGQEGFTVDTAASGAAALERAACFEPDVILMDVDMPLMSGVEATRRVLDVIASARVMFLGYHEEGLVDAIPAGACGYLGKDATLQEFVAAIRGNARGDFATSSRVSGAGAAQLRAVAGGSGLGPAAAAA